MSHRPQESHPFQQTYDRALNEISHLKKALSQQKNSHQNTLQQLQNTYDIIEQSKALLKTQQSANHELKRQLQQKDSQISSQYGQYEEHLNSVKMLIEEKDKEIKKYIAIVSKVSDYDMIRLKIINEVEVTHKEEIDELKAEIERVDLMKEEIKLENEILKEKNVVLQRQVEKLYEKEREITQQHSAKTTTELNHLLQTISNEKKKNKSLQKKLTEQKQRYEQIISKYHQQLNDFHCDSQQNNSFKGNHQYSQSHRHDTNSNNNVRKNQLTTSDGYNQYSYESQNLKRQIQQLQTELEKAKQRHKSEISELKKRNRNLQEGLQRTEDDLSRLKHEERLRMEQERQREKKRERERERERQLEQQSSKMMTNTNKRQNETKQLQRQLEILEKAHKEQSHQLDSQNLQLKTLQQANQALKHQNKQLQNSIKNLQQKIDSLMSTQGAHSLKLQQRRNKSISEFQASTSINGGDLGERSQQLLKNKLKQANAQIVELLKDKIELKSQLGIRQQG